jgi:hypothetical protein
MNSIIIAFFVGVVVSATINLRQICRQRQEISKANEHIAFLERELDIAVNISKRLDESLTERLAHAYTHYVPQEEAEIIEPSRHHRPLIVTVNGKTTVLPPLAV